jgi:hypothetical protein
MSTLQTFLGYFPSAKPSGQQWLAKCPAHDDRTASLAIREGTDQRILLHCHAGCETEAILSALGLDAAALFLEDAAKPSRAKMEIAETYDYRDPQTHDLLYQVCRLIPKDFRPRRPNGKGGWLWNLTDVRRVLYRLDEWQGQRVGLIVEGEKDVDAAWALGIPATTNVGGAGKWRPEDTQYLVDAGVQKVAIIPDADVPGRQHAIQVAYSTFTAGLEVRIVPLPDLPPKGDLSDYLQRHTKDDLRELLRAAPVWKPETSESTSAMPAKAFERTVEGFYRFSVNPPGIVFELDRLRRDHHELCGELTVRCTIAGAVQTPGGSLLTADFNLSSARARQERAKLLASQAKTADTIDWMAALGEFCEQVFDAERAGAPAIRLDERELPMVMQEEFSIDGISLLHHHPVILFGDGGTAKSYLSLYLAGRLAQQGQNVLFADWELLPDEHRDRLERLFGFTKPAIWYVTCDRPLVSEQERLQKIIRANHIGYLVVDSVAVACDGPPEAAEVTTAYFRAIRSLGVGSLHLAHTNRSEQADQKPFGSAFWHNLARATWFCRRSHEQEATKLTIGLYHRKSNLGRLHPPAGFTFTFDGDLTCVSSHGIDHIADLATGLPLWQRIKTTLGNGAMTLEDLAGELDAKKDTIERVVRRKTKLFERVPSSDGSSRIRLVR